MVVVNKFIYLCDKKKPCNSGFSCREGLCKHTADADHAKNGEIHAPSEAVGRFDEVLIDENTIHYVEREVEA